MKTTNPVLDPEHLLLTERWAARPNTWMTTHMQLTIHGWPKEVVDDIIIVLEDKYQIQAQLGRDATMGTDILLIAGFENIKRFKALQDLANPQNWDLDNITIDGVEQIRCSFFIAEETPPAPEEDSFIKRTFSRLKRMITQDNLTPAPEAAHVSTVKDAAIYLYKQIERDYAARHPHAPERVINRLRQEIMIEGHSLCVTGEALDWIQDTIPTLSNITELPENVTPMAAYRNSRAKAAPQF